MPDDPSKAFLIRRHSFGPYTLVLFPILFLSAGVPAVLRQAAARRVPPTASSLTGGWFEIRRAQDVTGKFRLAMMIALGWHGIGVLAWGHYFAVAQPPYDLLAIIATGIYEAIGCIPVVLAIYYFRLSRNVAEASVSVDADRFGMSQQIQVKVDQPALKGLYVQELSLGLICEETLRHRRQGKTRVESRTCHEHRAPIIEQQQVRAGETLSAATTLTVPPDEQPSSPPDHKGYPRYAWRIEVLTRIADSPDYRGKFPITVHPA